MTAQISRRNSYIELLRFFFMFLIVLIHIYGHGSHLDYDTIFSWGRTPDTAIHLVLFSLGQMGVTGFMFISGYYGIKMNKDKWINMLAMLTFYAVILTFITNKGTIPQYLFFFHAFDLWWFVSCYLFICLLSPLIGDALQRIDKNTFRFIVLGSLFYTYFAHFLIVQSDTNVAFLLTVYLAARYIKLYPQKFTKYYRQIAIISLMILCSFSVIFSILELPSKVILLFFSNNNILLLALSASLVIAAERKHRYIPFVNYLSSSVLAIYLITDFPPIREILDPFLQPFVMKGYGIIFVVGVCLVCVLVDKGRSALFKVIGL